MITGACAGSFYCLGVFDKTEECFNKDEWIISDNISFELIKSIVNDKYRLLFLKEENIFSHEMNILRKAIENNHTKIIIGAQELFPLLNHAECIAIDIKSNKVKIDGAVYQFEDYNYYTESSEVLEYDIENRAICYRPDYYYHKELASIVAEGFTKAGKELIGDANSYAEYKNDGRVWCVNGLFPSELTQYLIKNPKMYFENIESYLSILNEIFEIAINKKKCENLRELLVNHFKYSTLFSFSLPYLTQTVIEEEGVTKMEEVYSIFVKNSPIQNKELLTKDTIIKMETLISCTYNKKAESGTDTIQTHFIDNDVIENIFSVHDLILFVANMTSELRRCVINLLIDNNVWFKSICVHRKKHSLY